MRTYRYQSAITIREVGVTLILRGRADPGDTSGAVRAGEGAWKEERGWDKAPGSSDEVTVFHTG